MKRNENPKTFLSMSRYAELMSKQTFGILDKILIC